MLEMTENMFIEPTKDEVVTTKATSPLKSHLLAVPSIPIFPQDWLKKFMIGPWKEDAKNLSANKNDEVRKFERELWNMLKTKRRIIAVR